MKLREKPLRTDSQHLKTMNLKIVDHMPLGLCFLCTILTGSLQNLFFNLFLTKKRNMMTIQVEINVLCIDFFSLVKITTTNNSTPKNTSKDVKDMNKIKKIDFPKTSPQLIPSRINPRKENIKKPTSKIKTDQEKAFNKEFETILGYKTISPKNKEKECEKNLDVPKGFRPEQISKKNNVYIDLNQDKNDAMHKTTKMNPARLSSDDLKNGLTKLKDSKKIEKNSIATKKIGNKNEHLQKKLEINMELQPSLENFLNFQNNSEENNEIKKDATNTNAKPQKEKRNDLNNKPNKKSETNTNVPHSLEKIDDLENDSPKKIKKKACIPKQNTKKMSSQQNEEKNLRNENIHNIDKNRNTKKCTFDKEYNGKSLEKHDFVKISKMHQNIEMTENEKKEEFEKSLKCLDGMNNETEKNPKITKKINSKNIKLSLSGDYKELPKVQTKKEEGFFKYVVG